MADQPLGTGSTPETKLEDARGRSFSVALQVLRVLLEQRSSQGVTQISQATGFAKSSTHNVLIGLIELGFVERDGDTQRYSLSPQFFEFLRPFATEFGPNARAQDFLQHKAEKLGCTLFTATLTRGEVYIISAVGIIGGSFSLGSHAPAYASSPGKVLVAQMPRERWPEYAPNSHSLKLTAGTNINPERFILELEDARKTGVARNIRESNDELCSVAACIPEPGRTPRFAIAIVFRSSPNLASAIETHSVHVKSIATELGEILYPHVNKPGTGSD